MNTLFVSYKEYYRCLYWIAGFIYIMAAGLCIGAVDSSDGGKPWVKRDIKKVRPSKNPDERSQYGGAKEHREEATGYFHVIKKSKAWWMVDPEGYLFFSVGLNSVESKRVNHEDEDTWARETADLLADTGFNTIGRWSDFDEFKAIGREIPWCNTLSFMKNYAQERSKVYGAEGFPNETIPVFDEKWPEFCEQYAMKHAKPHAEDKWLLGNFSDNELPFRPDALKNYLELPESDAGHQAALKWMDENRVSSRKVDDPEVQQKFLEVVAKLYFETVAAALKKADPHHLYIGSRLHGRCINEAVLRGSSACDVVSINYYHRWEAEEDRLEDWEKWSGRPFLVGEFYAMKVVNKKTVADGAGFRVLNYEDAGDFYHTYTSSLLENIPSCVGWHWFKYANDTEEWQKGIVSTNGDVHKPLVEAMKIVNEQVYSLRGLR